MQTAVDSYVEHSELNKVMDDRTKKGWKVYKILECKSTDFRDYATVVWFMDEPIRIRHSFHSRSPKTITLSEADIEEIKEEFSSVQSIDEAKQTPDYVTCSNLL